jgi:hypothetical protein
VPWKSRLASLHGQNASCRAATGVAAPPSKPDATVCQRRSAGAGGGFTPITGLARRRPWRPSRARARNRCAIVGCTAWPRRINQVRDRRQRGGRQPHPKQGSSMSMDTVSPLRQRMVDDMNAGELGWQSPTWARPAIDGRKAMKFRQRQFLHLAAGAASLPALSRIAWAQAYPARPVRIIVRCRHAAPTAIG